jgi:putative ABC transport system permease protein
MMRSSRIALRLRLAVSALAKSGTRAGLALAAVGVGIAATMVTLALAAGAERELSEIAARVGSNLMMVSAAKVLAPAARGGGWYLSRRLDRNDVARLEREVGGIAALAPILEGSRRVELGRDDLMTMVRGAPPGFLDLRRFGLAAGRRLDARDEVEARRVAVVGASVAERLSTGASIVGRTLVVEGVPLEVVGVLAAKGMSADGQNEDDQIVVPLETARRRVFRVDWLSRLLIQTKSAEQMGAVERATRAVLRERHFLTSELPDDFQIVPLVRTSEIRRKSLAFLRGLADLFAAVTLAVGGVGVLATSFLGVRERTAEIGLRRAVGARRRDIARLFVGETTLLSATGGALGLVVGLVAVALLERTVGWRMAINLRAVVLPMALSLVLGLVFGVAPALAAARVEPIEALREN